MLGASSTHALYSGKWKNFWRMVPWQGGYSIPVLSGGGSVFSAGLGGEKEGFLHN